MSSSDDTDASDDTGAYDDTDGTVSDPSTTATAEQTAVADRKWNLPTLKKEVARLIVRAHKKVGKASQRLQRASEEVDRLTSDPNVSLDELDRCPSISELEADLEACRDRLIKLNRLEVLLADVSGKNGVVLPRHIANLTVELDVSDELLQRQSSGSNKKKKKKKEKGPKGMQSFRLPYRRYYSKNDVEIRVGKQAEDNDELSCNPEHRDGADWWMHASGCPGSHVVIRCHDSNPDDDVVQDAAALAARQSKCTGQVIKVSMTRARDVRKPAGAKPGLVQLTGQVRTISVNMKKAQERLDRLDVTVLVN